MPAYLPSGPVASTRREVQVHPLPRASPKALPSVAKVAQFVSSLCVWSDGAVPVLSRARTAAPWRSSRTVGPFAMTSSTWFVASENAMPCLVSACPAPFTSTSRQVLTASTSPAAESSGPPLFPELIAASVCTRIGRFGSWRTDEMRPAVSVWRAVWLD